MKGTEMLLQSIAGLTLRPNCTQSDLHVQLLPSSIRTASQSVWLEVVLIKCIHVCRPCRAKDNVLSPAAIESTGMLIWRQCPLHAFCEIFECTDTQSFEEAKHPR